MVLKSKWADIFGDFLIAVAFSVALYAIMAIVHFVWFCMRPEDTIGVFYFVSVLFVILGLLAMVFTLVGFAIKGLYHHFSWMNILKGIGFTLAVAFFTVLNFFQLKFPELKLYQQLADKYKYLEASKSFIAKKQYTQALASAKDAYAWAYEDRTPSPMFPLTVLYSKTEDVRRLKADEVFAATINYAYCLAQFDSLQGQSIARYQQALQIANEPLLAERSGYKIFPLSALIEIYLKQNKLDKVDDYHIQLLQHIQHADVADVEYFIQCRELLADHALEVGDTKTAAAIWISNHDLYQQAGRDRDDIRYLELSLNALRGHVMLHDLQQAGKLLKETEKLAKEKKKKSIYLEYLAIKGNYCDVAAAENTGYEELLDEGWWNTFTSLFNKKTVAEKFAALANDCYKELVERSEDKFGATSAEHLNVLFLYAGFQLKHGQFGEASTLYQQVADTKSKEAANDPRLITRARLMWMVCEMGAGKPAFDIGAIKKIEAYLYKDAAERLIYLTETERETYTAQLQEDIQLINAILLAANRDGNSTELYNNVLAFKNLILYSNTWWRNTINHCNNPVIRNAYLQLLQQKDTAATGSLDLLVQEKQLISKIRSLPGYQPYDPLHVTVNSIQQALEAGKSAVEYIAAPDLQLPGKPVTYYAVVVNHQAAAPTIIKLCKEDTLMGLLNKGGQLKAQIDSVYTYSLPALQSLLIDPVLRATDSAAYLFISLSGRLHQLSFTALLHNRAVSFEITGSTRRVVDNTLPVTTTKKAVVFGDIDYGYKNEHDFKALPYSASEMGQVRSLLQANQYAVATLSGREATESAFRELSGRHNQLLHLATHGFIDRLATTGQETPMSKCKLVFAGANRISPAAVNKNNDGIVTAQEIATLDFSGLEMAVLSACESGLGDLSNYEGIQGFQRAFTIAGARYTLVTLWSISDKHTAELMGYLYANIIAGQDQSAALFHAQMTMKQLYKDPYYWAGYMLIRG